jgi:hypothetical protein
MLLKPSVQTAAWGVRGWGRFLYRRPGAFTLPIAHDCAENPKIGRSSLASISRDPPYRSPAQIRDLLE